MELGMGGLDLDTATEADGVWDQVRCTEGTKGRRMSKRPGRNGFQEPI